MVSDEELVAAHLELANRCDGYRIWARHLVPDLVLYHHALDVIEHSHAVIRLLPTPVARAGVANARAAFEAAVDMLLLTAVEAEYDSNGAMARAAELLEMEALAARRDAANTLVGLESDPLSHTPEEAIEIEGSTWAKDFPSAKDVMVAALQDLRRKRRRHWSGLSRKGIADEIERRRGEGAGLAEMIDTTYGLLSIHSHPRPRTTDRKWDEDDQGRAIFSARPEHAGLARGVALISCQFATLALESRRVFGGAPSWQDGG